MRQNPELGIIESVRLGTEDHGIMTFMIFFDFGGSGQGFGGYCLDDWSEEKKHRVGTAFGMEAIMRILDAVGVENWEDLPNHEMWVYRKDDKTWGSKIVGIEAPKYRNSAGKPFFIQELVDEFKLGDKK